MDYVIYPRPSGRGSIEASPSFFRMDGRSVSYPRPSGRGSIEANSLTASSTRLKYYPRPSGRGSIEAVELSRTLPAVVGLSTSIRTWLH